MANNAHPVDGALIDFSMVKREMVEDFLTDDGRICEQEAHILAAFNDAVRVVERDRKVERAIVHIQRSDRITRYGKELWTDAGFSLEPLDAA